jgi:signal transduction histidine kinase
VEWRRLQGHLWRLEQQRAIEQERLRIAQDIHDDLGARVTQISLFSAMAQKRDSLPPEARADFGEVSRLTRSLVGALYETVWSVNPENDSLDALANFLCQVGNQLCSEAQLRCRLEVPSLPPSIPLTSQVRHNLIMAVKEAVHNVVKHARASEVRLGIAFDPPRLAITIQDDGAGFDPANHVPGNGLANLRRRLEHIGGECRVESAPGRGTRVTLVLVVPPAPASARTSPDL